MILSYCPNDGTPLQDTDRVCSRCGKPVQHPSFGPTQVPTQVPTYGPRPAPSPPQYPAQRPQYPAQRPAYSTAGPSYAAPKPPRSWFLWPVVNVPTRVASGVLDVGLAAVIAAAALVPVALLGRDTGVPDRPVGDLVLAVAGAFIAALLGTFLGTTGATPSAGQAAAGYRLGVNRTGEPAGLGRSLGDRALTVILLLAGGFAFWSVLWHPRHRGWPERITGAVMIGGRVPAWRSLLPLLTGVLGAGAYSAAIILLNDML